MELRNFFKKNNSKNTPKNEIDFEKKNNKFLKVFGCLALATFMGATALFTVAPFGATAANAATNTNLPNNAQTASPLGLDPENDPVVYTTSSGLEIKYANALSNTNLAGYTYFTLGEYSGEKLNWVIIGYNSNLNSCVADATDQAKGRYDIIAGYDRMDEYFDSQDFTPAGLALKRDYFAISPLATQSTELSTNCVLCISEKVLFTSIHCSGSWSGYPNSTGYNNLVTWFNGVTALVQAYNDGIILDQEYKVDTASADSGSPQGANISTVTSKVFIPGGVSTNGATFDLRNYMPITSTRIAYNLSGTVANYASSSTHSGYNQSFIYNTDGSRLQTGGSGNGSGGNKATFGVRPIIVCNFF